MTKSVKLLKAAILLAPLALLSGCCNRCAEAGLMYSEPVLSNIKSMLALIF